MIFKKPVKKCFDIIWRTFFYWMFVNKLIFVAFQILGQHRIKVGIFQLLDWGVFWHIKNSKMFAKWYENIFNIFYKNHRIKRKNHGHIFTQRYALYYVICISIWILPIWLSNQIPNLITYIVRWIEYYSSII